MRNTTVKDIGGEGMKHKWVDVSDTLIKCENCGVRISTKLTNHKYLMKTECEPLPDESAGNDCPKGACDI